MAGFSLLVNDTSYLLKFGYDEEYAKISPGNLLIEHMLQRYDKKSSVKVLNCISDAPGFNRWKPLGKAVFKYHLFNSSWKGIIAYQIVRLRYIISAVYGSRIKRFVQRTR